MENDTAYLLIGIEPTDTWPLVPAEGKFNGNVTAWTVYEDRDAAEAKMDELASSDEHETEWTVIPRRVE